MYFKQQFCVLAQVVRNPIYYIHLRDCVQLHTSTYCIIVISKACGFKCKSYFYLNVLKHYFPSTKFLILRFYHSYIGRASPFPTKLYIKNIYTVGLNMLIIDHPYTSKLCSKYSIKLRPYR